ncbi:MAG: Lrp/AsnC family transcriptional regulator [Candidatus Woesearchaeota archaeon]
MDLKDRKILFELSKNSRISLKQLSKSIGLSESSALYRLERLKKEEILLNTTTIINSYKLGYVGFRVYLSYYNTTIEDEKKLIEWLKNQEETSVIGIINNQDEIGIMSWVKNPLIFQNFCIRLKEQFGKFIKSLEISPYLGTIYYPRKYLSDNNEYLEIKVLPEEITYCDDLDLEILKILRTNSRVSSLEIANKLEKPAKTIINRIKKLEKTKVISGYGVNININKIGYEYYKLNIVFSENTNYKKLLEYAKNLKNSVYIDETINEYDFELNVEVKNKEELQNIINNLKSTFGGIKKLEIKQIEKYIKMQFL